MPRQLTDVEKFYIENNRDKPAGELAKKLEGVGARTVQKYIDALPEPEPVQEKQEASDIKLPKDADERAKLGLRAGQAIVTSRTDKRSPKGVTIMTEAASQIADENKKAVEAHSAQQMARKNSTRIHRPLGDKDNERTMYGGRRVR